MTASDTNSSNQQSTEPTADTLISDQDEFIVHHGGRRKRNQRLNKQLMRKLRSLSPTHSTQTLESPHKEAVATQAKTESVTIATEPTANTQSQSAQHTMEGQDLDAQGTILLFADVWDWSELRYLQSCQSWREVLQFRNRNQNMDPAERLPWFHAFHIEKKVIWNFNRWKVNIIHDPGYMYESRVFANLDVPFVVKAKLH